MTCCYSHVWCYLEVCIFTGFTVYALVVLRWYIFIILYTVSVSTFVKLHVKNMCVCFDRCRCWKRWTWDIRHQRQISRAQGRKLCSYLCRKTSLCRSASPKPWPLRFAWDSYNNLSFLFLLLFLSQSQSAFLSFFFFFLTQRQAAIQQDWGVHTHRSDAS
jgi:hypothetical protein